MKDKNGFYKAPSSKRKGVLYWGKDTYGNIIDIDGKQPYYTYQGIGSLTGGAHRLEVTHNNIPVQYNLIQVTHTI